MKHLIKDLKDVNIDLKALLKKVDKMIVTVGNMNRREVDEKINRIYFNDNCINYLSKFLFGQ
jgi:hypothetical protein